MKNFENLSNNKKALVVGKIAKMYDNDMSVQKIAEAMDMPFETVYAILRFILDAREKMNEIK